MIEKFDLTLCNDMGGNMNHEDFDEIKRIGWLINDDYYNINLHLTRTRLFASFYDTTYTIIGYCRIIQEFKDNLIAYIELGEYLKNYSYYDWAIITCREGLKHYVENEQLKNILKDAIEYSQS